MGKICIIVGHGKAENGGYDSGAVSGNFHEFKIAREIARFAAEYLNANYDIEADLMNYDGSLYLTDRIKAVNKASYDFIAEIHLNAGGGTGVETYYYHGSRKAQNYADKICDHIAEALGLEQRANYGDDRDFDVDKDGGDKTKLNSKGKDYFAIIRDTKPCAVLVETVFIDTPADLTKVKTTEGQRKCGIGIAEGIASAGGFKRKETEKPAEKKLYHVQVGPYSAKSEAEKIKDGLNKLGLKVTLVEV